MSMPFDYFVILAGMRTGSNFLEANLNEYPGLHCHGELYNPHFIGHIETTQLFGVTLAMREAQPMKLIRMMRSAADGLSGFRLFQDHDPRVLAACLGDRRCAKIVLSRNPVDSYVSLKIANATGQWRLGEAKHAKTASVTFDSGEFIEYAIANRDYLEGIVQALQLSGQGAFFISYDDVADPAVMNGLAKFLGVTAERANTSTFTKKQNPGDLVDKVTNPGEMLAALTTLDPHDLHRYPIFEPKRGPIVPQYVASAKSPLMYLPIRGGPTAAVLDWMARLDGATDTDLKRDFTQKSLRQWLRKSAGHRIFTVLRHPVPRLYDAFCRHFLTPGPEHFSEIMQALVSVYEMPFPDDPADPAYDLDAHRSLFVQFAEFAGASIQGQTSQRVDGAWASQASILQGIATMIQPDAILREDDLSRDLPLLAGQVGAPAPDWMPETPDWRFPIEDVYDDSVEQAVRRAYQRDYMQFGFRAWRPDG